jgi:hypothetical protein
MIAPHLLAESGVAALSKQGYQGVVIIDAQSQSNLRFANNNLTTNGLSFAVNATVIAMTRCTEPSVGISGGAVHSADQIAALVAEAITGAASTRFCRALRLAITGLGKRCHHHHHDGFRWLLPRTW